MERVIAYELRQVELTRASADVVALQYAQGFHGADRTVVDALLDEGTPVTQIEVSRGKYRLASTREAIGAPRMLVVGVSEAQRFSYEGIRRFPAQVLTILAREAPDVREVAMALPGASYGLDLVEAAQQQYLGVRDAIAGGSFPQGLEAVVIVERHTLRVEATAEALDRIADTFDRPPDWKPTRRYEWPIYPIPSPREARATSERAIKTMVNRVSREPERKKSVFVAMPFAREMRVVWQFGIRDPVRAAGLVCERVDEAHFVGDILERVWRKIEDAELIIADLTGHNPNVFLEVGYALAKERDVLFLHQGTQADPPRLPFDVATQRCLIYEDAVDLSEKLKEELIGLGLAR